MTYLHHARHAHIRGHKGGYTLTHPNFSNGNDGSLFSSASATSHSAGNSSQAYASKVVMSDSSDLDNAARGHQKVVQNKKQQLRGDPSASSIGNLKLARVRNTAGSNGQDYKEALYDSHCSAAVINRKHGAVASASSTAATCAATENSACDLAPLLKSSIAEAVADAVAPLAIPVAPELDLFTLLDYLYDGPQVCEKLTEFY